MEIGRAGKALRTIPRIRLVRQRPCNVGEGREGIRRERGGRGTEGVTGPVLHS